ncbi:hypothetical protein CEH05_16100 [Halobacillus halophilus]|uniref:Uncharacterized protein n=1 Tax=Halobacillus halophilus (strain ATCC 35676 / DSM 2266 / JCM 20832 / KCTC 3685 / LMG 17431 / NBRC 102448 / NCIMB 2269) TaxID=866895 RepID=I0JR23_HALH3|nr:hypothetical protein CEH05_16100 [Halobacillus halophilus]CCG46593.1 hypothetical protein HBHAL_4251 [Halobacillus halophilus DSM 2266]
MNNEEERKDDRNLQYYRNGFDGYGWEAINMHNRGGGKMSGIFNSSIQKLKDDGVNIKQTPMKKKDWKNMFYSMKKNSLICFRPGEYRRS